MAKFKVGGNTVIKIDNTAGSLIVLSTYIDSISDGLGKTVGQLDATTFGDSAERFIAGLEESQQFTVEGPFDDTATTGPDAVLSQLPGTIGTVEFSPVGTGATARKFSGEFLCTSYKVSGNVKEIARFQAVFQQDGTITVGTT